MSRRNGDGQARAASRGVLVLFPGFIMLWLMLLAIVVPLLIRWRETPPTLQKTAPKAETSTSPTAEEKSPRPIVWIEVNIPATEMTVYENGVPLLHRRVAIGSGIYPTPVQASAIKRIEWNPWWYPPPADWAKNEKPAPPGPGNPLGLVKMALSDAILFHGTNKEWTVGLPASHGCMRMANRDATEVAWYLQRLFSDQTDPALREQYRKNRGSTYPVELDPPVPVELVYRPVVVRNGALVFYPDHYNRLWGRKKAAIIGALLRDGIDLALIDDAKIDLLSRTWPPRGTAMPIENLLLIPPPPPFLGPECS